MGIFLGVPPTRPLLTMTFMAWPVNSKLQFPAKILRIDDLWAIGDSFHTAAIELDIKVSVSLDILSFFKDWLDSRGEIKAVLKFSNERTNVHYLGCWPSQLDVTNEYLRVRLQFDALDIDGNWIPDDPRELQADFPVQVSDRVWYPTDKHGDIIQPTSEERLLMEIEKELEDWLADPYSFEEKRVQGQVKYL